MFSLVSFYGHSTAHFFSLRRASHTIAACSIICSPFAAQLDDIDSICFRVLESLKAGKRLPEARFATLKVAAQGQHSVYGRYAERVTHEASSSKMSNGAVGEAASAGDNATPTC